jgi:hypothetical protein
MEESEGRNEERGVLIRKIETKKAQAKQMIKAHQEIIGLKKYIGEIQILLKNWEKKKLNELKKIHTSSVNLDFLKIYRNTYQYNQKILQLIIQFIAQCSNNFGFLRLWQ